MDSSTSSSSTTTATTTIVDEANGQRQESPMSVQEQPISGTIELTSTLTVPANNNDEVATTILTPEQEEERKLRLKYPNPQKPGGSTFIQKMLHKGCKKYFDSGDYNMAKSRTKAHLNSNGANGTTTTTQAPMPNSGRLVAPQRISEEVSTPNTSTNCSPNVSSTQSQNSTRLSTSPQTTSFTSSLNSSTAVQPSSSPQVDISTPSTNSSTLSNHHYHGHHQTYNQQTPSMHSRLSSSNIANSSPLVLFPSGSSGSSSSSSTTSTSTSSLHQPSSGNSSAAGRQLLSSSTSASNIMGTTAIMQVDPVLLNSADEIGHGIPTPECLPQSRKHAISQSKLATPRLSTS